MEKAYEMSDRMKRQQLRDLHEHNIINFIKDTCCEFYAMDPANLELPTRRREIITLRHTVYFFIKKYLPDMPFSAIGTLFSSQNHATVLHAIKNISNLAEVDKGVRTDLGKMDAPIRAYVEGLGIVCPSNDMFIDLGNLQLITVGKNKHIAVMGLDEREIKKIVLLFKTPEPVDYANTGLFLVEKKVVEVN